MKTRAFLFSLVFVLILASGWSWQPLAAQPDDYEEYFSATGHWIKGEFYTAYYRASDPQKVYGSPITEAFSPDPSSNTLVQFFEKGLFILRMISPSGQIIEVMPIGKYIYTPNNLQAYLENFTGCRSYTEGGYPVCYAFLEFFEAYGGAAQFGQPVSSIELQNNTMVQYFERARLEFHPELPVGKKMVVAELGYEYFYLIKIDPLRLKPAANAAIKGILNLKVRAFTQNSVTGIHGKQIIYVIVQDQRTMPVVGAQVVITIKLPDGQTFPYVVAKPSNEFGLAQFDFNFNSRKIGLAIVEVQVIYEGMTAQTVTSFRIWQ